MSDLYDERYTQSDEEVIKRKARKWHRYFNRRITDIEDLQQELSLEAFQKTHIQNCGDEKRYAFLNTIAEHDAINQLNKQRAKKRDCRRNISLDSIGTEAVQGPRSAESIHLQIDVQTAIGRMPPELQDVASLLAEYGEREIGEMLHMTRGQVRQRIQQIKRHMEKAGLAPGDQK